jgi:hypothetical protein
MRLQQSDFDQAVRYIRSAIKLLERESFSMTLATRELFDRIIRQLSPGDYFVGPNGLAAAIALLNPMADKVPAAPRVELLKAVAVLRDRT